MRNKGTKTVKLADIHNNMFVRQQLNEDWVIQLADLIEHGVEMRDLIEATNDNGVLEIVDGRHRKAAYELNNFDEIKVKVLEFDDAAEAVAYAYNRNKGSKPPSSADTEHTIQAMMKIGTSMKKIAEMLELPAKMVQRYIADVKAKEHRAALRRGEELVREENFKVTDAAKAVGVQPEALKGFLGGHRRRKGDVADIQKKLSQIQRSTSTKFARLLDTVLQKYEVGDLSKKQVDQIFDKVESLQQRGVKTTADRRNRFLQKVKNGDVDSQEDEKESA